jgi:hypothetical protein
LQEDDEEYKAMIHQRPSDLGQTLWTDEQWYTHMPSLSPNAPLMYVHTPIPTPPLSLSPSPIPHAFHNHARNTMTDDEINEELDDGPMWHWRYPGYFCGPNGTISQTLWLCNDRSSPSPHPEEAAAADQDHDATLIPRIIWLDHNDSNPIDQVATYVTDANEVMEQEGLHGDN